MAVVETVWRVEYNLVTGPVNPGVMSLEPGGSEDNKVIMEDR